MEWLAGFVAFVIASIVGMFPAHMLAYQAAPLPHTGATVLFAGDMMFDRTIRTTTDEKGGDYIFSCIGPILRDADFVVANLEGPITSTSSVSVGSIVGGKNNYTFTFPVLTARLLYEHNIRIVNIGNNHILNFGTWGLEDTKRYLDAAGVGYFGDPVQHSVLHKRVNGVALAFINYNEFAPPEHTNILGYVSISSTTVRQIREARAAGELPVVYTHWGIEYATTSSAYSRELAHSFIDAGAEVVIGSHPHVVEEHETYNGKNIYYSLGNFIFDQYWNDDVRNGLLLRVEFSASGVRSLREIPIRLQQDRRTCLRS